MKRGVTGWWVQCPAETLQRVHERLDGTSQSPREIFDALALSRYTELRTFRTYAARRRADRRARVQGAGNPDAGSAAPGEPSPDSLLSQLYRSLADALAAGDLKPTTAVGALLAVSRAKTLDFDAAADRRAEEKHAAWRETLRRQQDAALETVSRSNQLTPEQVAEIRAKVLGL